MSAPPYDFVKGDNLHQGDILLGISLLGPRMPDDWPNSKEIKADRFSEDAIILSQTCDLDCGPGRVPVENVVLCRYATKTELANGNHKLASVSQWENAAKNDRMPQYHCLPAFSADGIALEEAAILFRQIYTLPLEFVRHHARAADKRPRLLSPYREQLSQRFGHFFSRVAV